MRIPGLRFDFVAGLACSCLYSCFKLVYNLHAVFPDGTLPQGLGWTFFLPFGGLCAGYLICYFARRLIDGASMGTTIRYAVSFLFVIGTTVVTAYGTGALGGSAALYVSGVIIAQASAAYVLIQWVCLLAQMGRARAVRVALLQILFTMLAICVEYASYPARFVFCLVLAPATVTGLLYCRYRLSPSPSEEGRASQNAQDGGRDVPGAPSRAAMAKLSMGTVFIWAGIGFSRSLVSSFIGPVVFSANLVVGELLALLIGLVFLASVDRCYQIAFKAILFLMMVGYLLLWLPLENPAMASGFLTATASTLYQTTAMLLAADVARHAGTTAARPCSLMFSSLTFGCSVGMILETSLFGGGDALHSPYFTFVSVTVLLSLTVAALWLIDDHDIDLLTLNASLVGERGNEGKSAGADSVGTFSSRHGLTARETQILSLILAGRSVPYIEENLCISQNTINTHIRHIYQKVGVHDRQGLIDAVEALR
jgi:DNA-binding CsgD family transcriptional regulator